jgi:DNA-binding GntR family transcriptional regulator
MVDITATIPTIAQMRDHSLSGVVRHEIERLILSGELPTGTRVNENAIALRLGVSRGPVREACRALVELGLLDLIPNRGVFVRRMDRHDVEEVYDLRAGLTGLAGSLLASRITDAEIDRLRILVGGMDTAAEAGDFRTFYPINLEFHDVILQLTGNSRLIRSYRALVKEFQLFRTHGLVQSDALRESNQEHHAILAALERRDAAAAYEASFGHVQHGKQRMFAAFDKLTKSGPAAQHGEMHQRTIE